MTEPERLALLTDLAQKCAAPHGLVLDHLGVSDSGRRRALRIVVDTDISAIDPSDTTSVVAPVDLDAVAELAREVSARLDASDIMGERPYTLEVSSPGIGRQLVEFSHFRRSVGRKLRLTYTPEGGKTTEVTGRLVSASPEQLTITPDPVRSSPGAKPKAVPDVTVARADIDRANVEVDFSSTEFADTQEDH